MKYKLTLMGMLVISAIIVTQSPKAQAREERGGGGAAAAPAARAAAPAARMSAPAPQMRAAAPQQQRSYAPQQQQRVYAPQQQQRSYAPQQQQRSQERSFAPQAQPQRSQAYSQASRQNGSSRAGRGSASSPSQSARVRNSSENNLSSHQMTEQRGRETSSPHNRATNEQPKQSELGMTNHNAQSRNEARSPSREENAKSATAQRSESGKGEQANNARANQNWGASMGKQFAALTGGAAARPSVDKQSSFANPRQVGAVRPGMTPHFSANRPGNLSYRAGASNIPRAGRPGTGRAGIVDPGGYVRTPRNGTGGLNRNYINQQVSSLPNYNSNYSNNNRQRNGNSGQWPGGWNPGPNSGNLGYYPGYSYNGVNYPYNYYADQGYCPTPWLFFLNSGAFWQPGMGYADYLPYGYNQPISIAVNEVVPAYDGYGNIIGYQNETFYYNASWDPNSQAYGYYDYRGAFHWTTFPWLNTRIG